MTFFSLAVTIISLSLGGRRLHSNFQSFLFRVSSSVADVVINIVTIRKSTGKYRLDHSGRTFSLVSNSAPDVVAGSSVRTLSQELSSVKHRNSIDPKEVLERKCSLAVYFRTFQK